MSLVSAIEAELSKARADVGAAIEFFTHKAEAALKAQVELLKADEQKLASDVKDAIEQAKAAAIGQVQANSPEAAALVSQVLADIEAAVVAVVGKHLVP